jgi:internalin A
LVLGSHFDDLSPISRLSGTLEWLSIGGDPGTTIDLSALPFLVRLGAPWSMIEGSLQEAVALQDLTVTDYPGEDLGLFAENQGLHTLRLKSAPRLASLDGLGELTALGVLYAGLARRLVDLTALPTASEHLRVLELEACNSLRSLAGVESLVHLQKFGCNDCGRIESLAPLRLLLELEAVGAWGSTVVDDGDMTPLTGLPLLRELRMKDRRGYRPRVKDIQRSVGWTP